MGASSSKAARNATRRYPARSVGASVPPPAKRTPLQPGTHNISRDAEDSKTEAIKADGHDPDHLSGDFARRLQQMGVAQPNPTYSPSSTASSSQQPFVESSPQPSGPIFPASMHNSTLSVLEARRVIQQRADEDFEAVGRSGSTGRQFIDMRTLVDAMQLLDRGSSRSQVEKQLKLQPHLLDKLGPVGVFTHVKTEAKAAKDQW